MITHHQAQTLKLKIDAYVLAKIAESWKGFGDPAEIPALNRELRDSSRTLDKYIASLETPTAKDLT